jgi:aspartyl-tRNA(Asn)/glutamyl-tRNA(Gln) amidotransferase subunit C
MVGPEDVKYVAALAKLQLTDTEVEAFTHQLSSIVDYVAQLNEVDTSNVEPTAFVGPEHDPMRKDVVGGSLPRERILRNGPKVTKDHFAIPRVIG